MFMRPLLALTLAAALAGTAACGDAVSCTDMLPLPQVKFLNDGAPAVDGALAEVCLAEDCSSGPWRDGQAFVVLDALPREGVVELQLRTLAAGGAVIDEDSLAVEVQTVSPNGPGCEPQVGLVEVRRVEVGRYEQSNA